MPTSGLSIRRNVSPSICIDETAPSNGEQYIMMTNLTSRGRKGTLIAIVKGVSADRVTEAVMRIDERNTIKDTARLFLARWYDNVEHSGFKSFQVIAATLYEHYDEVLNFFVNRATNTFCGVLQCPDKGFQGCTERSDGHEVLHVLAFDDLRVAHTNLSLSPIYHFGV